MKKGWQQVKFSELFEEPKKAIISGPFGSNLKSAEYQTEGVPLVRLQNIDRWKFIDKNIIYITPQKAEELSSHAYKAGDILITKLGAPLGKACIAPESSGEGIILADIVRVRLDKDSGDKDFIVYQLNSGVISNQLAELTTGATRPRVTLKNVRELNLVVPPISEQKEIVAIIDEAFAAIDTARANLEKNLENTKELFESKLSEIFSQQGDNWKEKNLGEVCDNFQYGSSSKSLGEGKLPVLRMGNIQEGKIDWTNLKYSDNEVDNEKYLLNHDDIVFNRTNSPEHVGKTAIYKSEMPAIFAGYIIRVKVKEDVLNSDFLNFFLNSKDARDYGYSVMSSSVNQANINASKLKQYKIRLPDLETQVGLVKELQVLKNKTDEIETSYIRKLESISELKKSILQKAFTGELTSKDIAA